MKFTMKFLALVLGVLMLTTTANADSPREQLQQMVEQLQRNPADTALREKIIKLAQEIKPALAIPEEAERRMARGTAAFKGAKSVADYRDAAKEFEQATLAAPWYGDAYFNLGVAQDKAENYVAAVRSLKLAQLASPEVKEIKALIYEVEYRSEKANSPEVQAAKKKQQEEERTAKKKQQEQEARRAEEEMIRRLEGAIFLQALDQPTEWNKGYRRSHPLRIRGGSVERVDRQTGDVIHYLCGGFENNGRPEPIGQEMVCSRSGPFTGRIAVDVNDETRYEITADGREMIWTSSDGRSSHRYERQ
jgi:tetratricopeptide (TPR) repeat protein